MAAAAAVSGVRQQTVLEVSIAADGEAPAYYSYNNLAYLNADQNLGSLVVLVVGRARARNCKNIYMLDRKIKHVAIF